MEGNEEIRNELRHKLSKIYLDDKAVVNLISNANDYVLILNSNRQIIWVSNSFKNDFGYGEEEIASRTFDMFLHTDDADRAAQIYSDVMGKGDAVYPNLFVLRFRTKSGEFIPVELNLTKPNIIDEYLLVIARHGNLKGEQQYANQYEESPKPLTVPSPRKKGLRGFLNLFFNLNIS